MTSKREKRTESEVQDMLLSQKISRCAVKSKKQTAKQYISEKITLVQDGTALDQNSMHQVIYKGKEREEKIYTCLNVHKISLDGYTQKPTTPVGHGKVSLGCWGQK